MVDPGTERCAVGGRAGTCIGFKPEDEVADHPTGATDVGTEGEIIASAKINGGGVILYTPNSFKRHGNLAVRSVESRIRAAEQVNAGRATKVCFGDSYFYTTYRARLLGLPDAGNAMGHTTEGIRSTEGSGTVVRSPEQEALVGSEITRMGSIGSGQLVGVADHRLEAAVGRFGLFLV